MRILLSVLVLTLVGGLVFIKGSQFELLAANDRQQAQAGPPPQSVAVHTAQEHAFRSTLEAIGTLRAARGVVIANASPGLLKSLHFKSGQRVQKGQILARLDTSVEQARLAEARAQRQLAERTLRRTEPLRKDGTVSSSLVEQHEAQLGQNAARVEALKAEIALKTIRAPFSGRLGIRQVDLGQYLPPGTGLVSLEADDELLVDFNLPQESLKGLSEGHELQLQVPGRTEALVGKLQAISPRLNERTRNASLRAKVAVGPGLYPGMYVKAQLHAQAEQRIMIPTTAIVSRAYGDQVFVIEEQQGQRIARGHPVQRGPTQGDFTVILKGLKVGAKVVYIGAFKLFDGAPVLLDKGPNPQPLLEPKLSGANEEGEPQ